MTLTEKLRRRFGFLAILVVRVEARGQEIAPGRRLVARRVFSLPLTPKRVLAMIERKGR